MAYSSSFRPLSLLLLFVVFLSFFSPFASAQIEYGEGLRKRIWYNYPCHANPSDITEPWGASIQGYGTCWDKNSTTGEFQGGPAALWKVCVRVWVLEEKNETFPGGIPDLKGEHKFVDMQCICHPFFNPTGEQCSIFPSASSTFFGQLLYVLVGVFNVYTLLKCLRLTYFLLVSKKWQVNPAITTLLWIDATTINEAARNFMVPVVNSGSTAAAPLSQYQFNIATLIALPITVVFLNFAFMGVSLTWLEIAESASSGKGKSSSSKIRWMRRGAKTLMFLLTAVVIYLCGTGNTAKISAIGFIFAPIMVVLNYLGGKKLRQLLVLVPPGSPTSAKQEAPKFDIGECIKWTNRKIIVDCLFFVIWTIVLTISLSREYDVVDVDGRLYSLIAFSVLFVNSSIAFLCHIIYSYFEQSNRTTIGKMSNKARTAVSPRDAPSRRSSRVNVDMTPGSPPNNLRACLSAETNASRIEVSSKNTEIIGEA